MEESENNNNRHIPNQNHHLRILAVLGILIPLLSGIVAYWIMQPQVVFEKLPVIPIAENESDTTRQQHSIRSVTCVIVKSTGRVPASDVVIEIEASNFFPDRTGLHPKIWEFSVRDLKCEPNQKVYSLNKFAVGANFSISIPAPEEEPEIRIYGRHDGGEIIEMEKETPLILVILIGLSFSLGFLSGTLIWRYFLHK